MQSATLKRLCPALIRQNVLEGGDGVGGGRPQRLALVNLGAVEDGHGVAGGVVVQKVPAVFVLQTAHRGAVGVEVHHIGAVGRQAEGGRLQRGHQLHDRPHGALRRPIAAAVAQSSGREGAPVGFHCQA